MYDIIIITDKNQAVGITCGFSIAKSGECAIMKVQNVKRFIMNSKTPKRSQLSGVFNVI